MSTFNYDAVKDMICCPKTKADLVFTGEALVSCDPDSRLRYPIVDGFPVLLIDEARELPSEEWAAIMTKSGRDAATGQTIGTPPPKG